jgi:hypothetical protein
VSELPATLRDWIAEHNEQALLANGFEEAIVGVAVRCSKPPLVVYDAEKCIELLMEDSDMSEEDAREYFDFNVLGAWVGPGTPLFLWRKP